jgi:hypothetical protein
MGKTHSKLLAARQGRGMAWVQHAMCESPLNGKDVGGSSHGPISGYYSSIWWEKLRKSSKPLVRIMNDWTQTEPRVCFPPMPQQPLLGQVPSLSKLHNHRHTIFGGIPLDERSARQRDINLHITQHSQETNTHASSGIRTCNPSKQSATDPCFWLHGDWDQRNQGILITNQECFPFDHNIQR